MHGNMGKCTHEYMHIRGVCMGVYGCMWYGAGECVSVCGPWCVCVYRLCDVDFDPFRE